MPALEGEDDGTDHAVGVWRTGRWREATNGQGRQAKCGQDNDALYDEIRESAGIGHEGPADQVRAVSSALVSPTGEISDVWPDERGRGKGVGDCHPGQKRMGGCSLSLSRGASRRDKPSRLALKAQL